jgi:dipeptidyl aminopeptidase/acylaminoacyl peptidase
VGSAVWEQRKIREERSAIRPAKNFKTPMLITHSENDFRVPLGKRSKCGACRNGRKCRADW